MRFGDLTEHRVLEGGAGAVAAVAGDPADRGPGLGEDAVGAVGGLHVGLGEVGMHLDLVDCRGHVGPLQEVREHVGHDVADADRAHPAIGQQRLQRLVRADGPVEVRGDRLVQQEQIDLVHAELARALVEAVQGAVVAVVRDPQLGLEEHLGAIQAGSAEGLAHLALVAVGGSGVDQAVADAQRLGDRGDRLLRRGLEDAEAQRGHPDAVVQGEGGGHVVLLGEIFWSVTARLPSSRSRSWVGLPGSAVKANMNHSGFAGRCIAS